MGSQSTPLALRRLCVFCGSSPGARPAYGEAAEELGRLLAAEGIGLVYGGGKVGLMGRLADAVLAEGGDAIGVLPEALVEKEIGHAGLSDLRVVGSMHERKALMADLADGFVALPGGLGTVEELFEVYTWAQLGLHRKPCALLDVEGYYDGIARFLAHAVEQRFLREDHRAMLIVERDPRVLLDRLSDFEPQHPAQDRQRRGVGRVHAVVAQAAGAERARLGVGRIRGVVDDPEVHGELREVDRLPDRVAVGVGDLVERVAVRTRLHLHHREGLAGGEGEVGAGLQERALYGDGAPGV